MKEKIFTSLGFSDRERTVYLALLRLGPSSVRSLAEQVGLNRGTLYDTIKWLQTKNLVRLYDKQGKQHFVAEPPERLYRLFVEQKENLALTEKMLEQTLPELEALYHKGGERPVARYFEKTEIAVLLEDVLQTCEKTVEKSYCIYSAEGLREHLYESFPNFSDVRIAKGISVRVIALGNGGELRGFDERKWLSKQGIEEKKETYIVIYPGKVASISQNVKGELMGVVIENDGVYETQKHIFDSLWKTL